MLLPSAIWLAHLSTSHWVRQRMMWVVCAAAVLIPLSYFTLIASVIILLKFKVNTGWMIQLALYLPLVSILISAFSDNIVNYLERNKPDAES
jgi:hypothetical protein